MGPRVDSVPSDEALPTRVDVVVVGGGIIGTTAEMPQPPAPPAGSTAYAAAGCSRGGRTLLGGLANPAALE
jgi:hypothetical protein